MKHKAQVKSLYWACLNLKHFWLCFVLSSLTHKRSIVEKMLTRLGLVKPNWVIKPFFVKFIGSMFRITEIIHGSASSAYGSAKWTSCPLSRCNLVGLQVNKWLCHLLHCYSDFREGKFQKFFNAFSFTCSLFEEARCRS